MQIIPFLEKQTTDVAKSLENSTSRNSYSSAMFDSFLYSHQQSVDKIYKPVQKAVNEISSTAHDSIKKVHEKAAEASTSLRREVNEARNEASKTSMRDVKVDPDKWKDIKKELKEYGMDKKDIEELEKKVMSKEGLTFGVLVSQLSHMMNQLKTVDLTATQKQNLNSIFNKLGFNPAESKSMMTSLSQGKFSDVISKIQNKLSSLSDGTQLNLSKEEAATLTSIFKLSNKDAKQVSDFLTAKNGTVAQMKKGLMFFQKALSENNILNKAKDIQLVKGVSDALKKTLESLSDQNPNGAKVASAKVITDSMGVSKEIADNANKNVSDNSTHSSIFSKKISDQLGSNNSQSKNQGQEGFLKDGTPNDSNKHWLDKVLSDSKNPDEWSKFFSKIKIEGSGSLGNSNGLGGMLNNMATANKGALHNLKSAAPNLTEKNAHSNILEQVQKGAFKNLGQGKSQITLKLNPLDLGTVNVALQVKNKEVRAVIKVDNPETAKVIADQLDSVKKALENQGLKVEKLDVQAGISDGQTQSSWNGAEDHNSSQYREMMSEMKKRWQTLKSEGTNLAQNMQSIDHTATISQSGLHVVA